MVADNNSDKELEANEADTNPTNVEEVDKEMETSLVGSLTYRLVASFLTCNTNEIEILCYFVFLNIYYLSMLAESWSLWMVESTQRESARASRMVKNFCPISLCHYALLVLWSWNR